METKKIAKKGKFKYSSLKKEKKLRKTQKKNMEKGLTLQEQFDFEFGRPQEYGGQQGRWEDLRPKVSLKSKK